VVFICAIGIAFFSVVRMRLILYLVCSILVVLGVIGFIALIFLAIAAPLTYQTCSYIDVQLSTSTGTANLFTNLGIQDIGAKVSVCMNGSSKIIQPINSNLSDALDNIKTITTNTQTFNTLIGNYSTTNIKAPFSAAQTILTNVYNAYALDVNDSISLNHLSAISSKSYPVDPLNCISSSVNTDSWVASYTTGTCPVGMSKMYPCSNLGDKTICPSGCY
jgi:hypothetical protein